MIPSTSIQKLSLPIRVLLPRLTKAFRVLAKSVSLIESLNSMPDDQDAQKFQWHIGGHACFQSIMHIVSEVETTEFKAPNHSLLRARAVEVLRKTMDTRGGEATPMWKVINRIISNCLAKNAPANPPLTPFQTVLPRNGVIPGIWSSTTASSSAVPQSLSASGESAIETSLLDLSEIGRIDMQDPVTSFDWVSCFNLLIRSLLLTMLARDFGTLTLRIPAPIKGHSCSELCICSRCLPHALQMHGTCHKSKCSVFVKMTRIINMIPLNSKLTKCAPA
jgi:hypothetical protein